MRQVHLASEMTAAELKAFKAEVTAAKTNKVRYRMDETHYDTLIAESGEVLTPKGKLLGVLVRGCVPAAALEDAYPYLRMVDGDFTNRGTAIGLPMSPQQRLDGSFTKTQRVDTKDLERENVGLNDYFGFWEGKAQRNNPFPHETSFTRWIKKKHPEFFANNQIAGDSCTRNSFRVSGRFYIVAGAAEQGLSHGGTRSLE